MDNPSIIIKSKYCQKHNQPFRYYDKNGRNPQCEDCLLQRGGLITFEQIQKQYQEIIIINIKENDLQLQQLYTLREGILKYKEKVIITLDKLIQQIIDQIQSIESKKQSMQQLDMVMNQYESTEDFINFINNNQNSNIQFINKLKMNLLLEFKQNIMKIDFLHSILNQKQHLIQKKGPEKMECDLIQKVKSSLRIFDFAIDQRNNTLIVGMGEGCIKIFNFQNGKVGAEIQNLNVHTDYVSCLYCMKNTHSFISGSGDSQIIIWSLDKFNKWKVQQTLNDHSKSVTSIIMNSKEDLLISGSYDNTVKFWKKLNDFWNFSQTVGLGSEVYALCLNENEDKLVACNDTQIVVMNIKRNQQFTIVQIIEVNEFGFRLCFTIQNQFIFQPSHSEYLVVYDYDKNKQQFYQYAQVQEQKIQIENDLFPCQYIKNLNLLIVKHGQFVNIFQVNQNGEYYLIQSVEYPKCNLNGRMTDDGEFLITYDIISEEIQVRQFKLNKKLF